MEPELAFITGHDIGLFSITAGCIWLMISMYGVIKENQTLKTQRDRYWRMFEKASNDNTDALIATRNDASNSCAHCGIELKDGEIKTRVGRLDWHCADCLPPDIVIKGLRSTADVRDPGFCAKHGYDQVVCDCEAKDGERLKAALIAIRCVYTDCTSGARLGSNYCDFHGKSPSPARKR